MEGDTTSLSLALGDEAATSSAPAQGIHLHIATAPRVNFACQQNAVPVIREIEIIQNGGQTLQDLVLEMRASPAFLTPKTWRIDRLLPDGTLHINDRDTRLDGEYLLGLQEKQRGELIFALRDGDGNLLAEAVRDIEVLARNEWGGYSSSPEILASFCMPNEPAIERLLKSTSDFLAQQGLDRTLETYQKADGKRILIQASALWSVLRNLKLDYAYPPSSFENTGQKIRTADAILDARRATCLDTTLLLAALFEQMRLNSVIILEQGHAYVGLWLRDEGFARPYLEDLLALRKRVQLRELAVLETTLLCQNAPFTQAMKQAEDTLNNSDGRFVGVLDIARARDEQIRPLSFVHQSPGAQADTSATPLPGNENPALDVPSDADLWGGAARDSAQADNTPAGRLAQWQRKLLDLTLRNPLLNMRSSKTNIPLIAPNVGLLEDVLAEGKALAIEPVPLSDVRDEQLHTQQTGHKLDEQIALTALRRGKIYAPVEQTLLEAALLELYRKARNDLEEGGANTLFLAIGILYWQRPGADEKTYRAPLILIPVSITRQSVRSGIKLTLNDDEPRFNTTLLEMLRQDFALDVQGLDGPLPADHSGTDIAAILERIKREVRDVAGFEVRDDVTLGTFSFAKYLMWKDLVDRTDQLKDNPVVRHLIDTPREPFAQTGEFVQPRELDARISPATLFTPLSSDSSQLAAVIGSAEGRNFVMIGPPGTGKSQTISNMIAHNLGLGRTVLFVSEKAAALDVVYRRLREQGLGEFCLELHSNKARKLDVLRQLGDAWNVRGELSVDEWTQETKRLQQVRDELNQLVNALHEIHSNGMSVRSALATAAGMADVTEVKLSWPNADQHDRDAYERLLAVGERIDLNAAEIGSVAGHPLAMLHASDWSMGWQQAVLQQTSDLIAKATAWREQIQPLATRLQLRGELTSRTRLQSLTHLVQALLQSSGKDLAFAFAPAANDTLQAIAQVESDLNAFSTAQTALSCSYNREQMLQADLRVPQALWSKAQQSWWLPRIILGWNCRRFLRKQAGASAQPDPEKDLPQLKQLQSLNNQIMARSSMLEKVAGWRGLDSDAAAMSAHGHLATALRSETAALAQDPDELIALRSEVRKLAVDANEMLTPSGAVGAQLTRFIEAAQAFQQALEIFAELAQRSPDDLLDVPRGLDDLVEGAGRLAGAQPRMNAWCAWRRVRAEAMTLGLAPVVQAIEQGVISPGGARQVIEANYARWWVVQKIDGNQVLRHFVSVEHERKIIHFRELDTKVRALTATAIRAHVRKGLVEKDDAKKSSGFGIIRRELEKKTRHKPLRQLISETGNAIPTLTPCLLMSPLSIAQYLPVDQPPFDLVIFDEASQITVWDAIGALARGKQSIVVGDPKQLPPTSFFSAGQSDEIDPELEEDLESILDEMLGANMPTIHLSWHYRSRSESLITFSNHRYYKGELITFPSPVTQDTAVSFAMVGGVYDRGGSQTNRDEATAIVAEIEKRLTNPATASQTLGVVTFNQKQQTLILDLLEAARRQNPELDRHFAEDLFESVFVKNLESVQGDERDVILFSTTFGPDKNGILSMNFGPLNKSGGERRLNVAITRARCELKVFSSLRAEQIDLSRTAAIGVRDLKHFLEFAERGPGALGEAAVGVVGEFDSLFEAAVSRGLQARGWTVHPQIGVSRFRVNLGVVNPDVPGSYLAGIECDGSTYQRSATARDRDLIRESVLRGLGWEILRLWSTDYWLDSQGVMDKLHQQLQQLLAQQRKTGVPL